MGEDQACFEEGWPARTLLVSLFFFCPSDKCKNPDWSDLMNCSICHSDWPATCHSRALGSCHIHIQGIQQGG